MKNALVGVKNTRSINQVVVEDASQHTALEGVTLVAIVNVVCGRESDAIGKDSERSNAASDDMVE